MQLTLEQHYGITLTPSGVVIPENASEQAVKEAWKTMRFLRKFASKGDKDCREFFEKKWGFHKALVVESEIITELGFSVSAKITDEKEESDPIPVTAKFVKMFSDLRERWKKAIDTGNVEYLKLAADALRPMVEEWKQINEFLETHK